jgi:3-methyladenine DNA glycosylase/8-oxoguanine DNA glycosylase
MMVTDSEILERLTSIKGIGRSTGEMVLVFYVDRPAALPVLVLSRGGTSRAFKTAKAAVLLACLSRVHLPLEARQWKKPLKT